MNLLCSFTINNLMCSVIRGDKEEERNKKNKKKKVKKEKKEKGLYYGCLI